MPRTTKHVTINETNLSHETHLIAGATIVIPHGQVLDLGWLGVEALDLGPHALPGAVNPDVGGAHPGALGQVQVLLQHRLVGVGWPLNTGHFGFSTSDPYGYLEIRAMKVLRS